MKRVLSLLVLMTLLLLSFAMPAVAQDNSLLQIDVNAGFDGHYRGNMWMPLFIRVRNDGDDISGRLVVRPETSGSVVDNTFSTAIELPSGSRKSTLLYIVPSGFGSQVRVELISNDGAVLSSANQRIQSTNNLDTLFVVVTAAASGSVDMTGVRSNGYDAYQTNWNVENIPSYGAALQAVNLMLFSSIDTGTLTAEQRTAIGEWVAAGGHLVVTGGSNWQATAAGFADLLPMTPTTSATVSGLPEFARWTISGEGTTVESTLSLTDAQAELNVQTLVSVGTLRDGVEVLVEGGTVPPTPLLVRRNYGSGVVDYLTADPNTQPLRGWQGLGGLWFTMMNSRAPLPSWGHSYTDWASAESATQIIPGFNLLPDTFALCGFLALYIGLIGPLNYFILNRLNRREYAWFSIPVLIVVFSAVAWVTGFNLRGTDVTLNRMTLIQSWPDVEHAQVDGLLFGLLAPRRATYTLTLGDNSMLRTVPQQAPTGLFGGALAGPDIQQGDSFLAANFPVDASFIAGFNVNGTMPRPDIGGQASLSYDNDNLQSVRGAVSNDSEWTLIEPVILARGTVERFTNALAPGDTVPFSFQLIGEGLPEPMRVDTTPRAAYYYSTYNYTNTDQTILQILGDDVYASTQPYYYGYGYYNSTNDPNWQADTRRRAFLTSFLADYFSSTGRGDRVYLVGWVETSPTPLDVTNVSWRSQDLTLLIAELDIEVTPPSGRVTIRPDRFTWSVRERNNINSVGPYNLSLYSDGEIIFRYTPLPDAVLSSVDRLILHVESDQINSGFAIQLWNWDDGRWDEVEINRADKTIPNPARYLGPQNAVEIRIFRRSQDLSLTIRSIWIEQRGTFQ